MKHLVIILSLLSISLGQGVQFRKITFAEALQAAAAENKVVFVDMMADWCGPCKQMDKEVFNQEDVGEYWNAHYVSIKINLTYGIPNSLDSVFNFNEGTLALPTLLFFSPRGEVLYAHTGGIPKDYFMEVGKTALDPAQQLPTLQKTYAGGDCSPEFLARYLTQLSAANATGTQEVYNELLRVLPPEKYLEASYAMVLYSWDTKDVAAPHMVYLADHMDAYDKVYGAGSAKEYLAYVLQNRYNTTMAAGDEAGKKEAETMYIKVFGQAAFDKLDAEASINTAYQAGQWDTAFEQAKKLKALGASLDAEQTNAMAWACYEQCTEKAHLQAAIDLLAACKPCLTQYESLDTYSALLLKLGKKKEGMVMAKKAIAAAKKADKNYSGTQELIDQYK